MAIVHHNINVHEFPGHIYIQCAHATLTEDQQCRKMWLTPDSPAHNALKEVVLLKDIWHFNEFRHSASLEIYHRF